jgi:hypothetical protein
VSAAPPGDLVLDRHRDLAGRTWQAWVRRALLAVVAVLPLLALFNVFGQRPVRSHASGPAGSLRVTAPQRLRGGLIYQGRFDITARRRIQQPTLILDHGWSESTSVNAIAPNPVQEASRDGRWVVSYGRLNAGHRLTVWIYYQVNPTNTGRYSQNVELDDDTTLIARVQRSLIVFP